MPRVTEKWREQIEKGVMPESVHKTFVPESVVGSEADGVRKAAFVVSTGTEDRDGDVVSPTGWMLDSYRKNPVVLWAHDVKSLPVARAEEIGVVDGRLKSVTVFPQKGVYPFADQVFGLVRDGFLKGTSVGFHPIEAEPRKGKSKGVQFNRQELYEFSILPIPSNREALAEAKAAGHDIGAVVKWASDFLDYAEANGIWVPKFQIEKALKLVLPLQVTVPAMPRGEAGAAPEGHAMAGAAPSDAEVKGWLDAVQKHGDHDQSSHGNRGGGGEGHREPSEAEMRQTTESYKYDDMGSPDDDMSRFTQDNRDLKLADMEAAMASGPKDRTAEQDKRVEERMREHGGKLHPKFPAASGPIKRSEDRRLRALAQDLARVSGRLDQYTRDAIRMVERGDHKVGPKVFNGIAAHLLDVWDKQEKLKEAEMDVIKSFADSLFGEGVSKEAPPWAKEEPPKDGPPQGAEDPGEQMETGEEGPEGEAAEADPGQTPGAPSGPEQGGAGQDALTAALLAEVEPLKAGGDPTQIATALKAALEKFAAAFMQTYAVPGAAPAAPGATPPPTHAPAQAPPAPPQAPPQGAQPPAAPAAKPQAPPPPPGQKPPFPPKKEESKGFGLDDLAALNENELREMIQKGVRRSMDEARMHLTGRLPG